MKHTLLLLAAVAALGAPAAQAQSTTPTNLSNVTFGFGAGYSYSFFDKKEYSLSTDTVHALKIGNTTNAGFVISSTITVRLSKVASKPASNRLYSQDAILKTMKANAANKAGTPEEVDNEENEAKWYEKFTMNLAINLADVNSDGLSFNKPVDGGLGLGYSFGDNTQIALFFDVVRIRQLRDYVAEDYVNKPIPKGKDVYTALDGNDNELFTTKTASGLSVKLIYVIPSK